MTAVAAGTVVVAGGATAVAAAAAAAAARRRRRDGREAMDPCGRLGLQLPPGTTTTVAMDDGAELSVTVAGPDDGPTVVLAHCWTGTSAFWGPVARRLVLAGHRVVLYDQRGHGASSFGDGVASIGRLGRDLATVLAAVDVRDCVLVGHSMGGMAIQSYVVDHADDAHGRVYGLVLAATASRVSLRSVPPAAFERLMGDGRLEWSRRNRAGDLVGRGALGRRPTAAHVAATAAGFRDCAGPTRVGCIQAMAAMDLRPGLESVDIPATVIVGTRDLLTPPRRSRELAARLPHARLVVLPGRGHMLPLEEPDAIVGAVLDLPKPAAPALSAVPAALEA